MASDDVAARVAKWSPLVFAVRDALAATPGGRLGCIEAVGALVDAATVLGLGTLRPLVVRAFIYNQALVQRVGDLNAPDAADRIRHWTKEDERCAYVLLGIGDVPAGDWAGHLVAVDDEPEMSIILDPTIEQVNQPAHNIVLSPLAVPIQAVHLQGRGGYRFNANTCVIEGKAFPDERSFEQTPAWRERTALRDYVVRRIRDGR